LESINEREHLEKIGVDTGIILKCNSEIGGRVWAGFIWLGIDTSGGLL
jgi:hypothetical protein